MTFEPFDVVLVPFPFTDAALTVKRPAMVLSRSDFNAHGRAVLSMITDQRNEPWPLDVRIDHTAAGLKMPSVARMKLFTLDTRLILRRIGRLGDPDRKAMLENLRRLLPGLE